MAFLRGKLLHFEDSEQINRFHHGAPNSAGGGAWLAIEPEVKPTRRLRAAQ